MRVYIFLYLPTDSLYFSCCSFLQSSGGRIVTTLADMEGNETFDPECLGDAEEVSEERVGDGELIFVKGTKVGEEIVPSLLLVFVFI